MGVSGSGKSVIGRILADRMGAVFADGDDFHPPENRAKMTAGTPLTDEDRRPWLERLRSEIIEATPPGGHAVVACSALKRSYRAILQNGDADVLIVHLHGTPELIHSRMAARRGHFMPLDLLRSQLATLEFPGEGEAMIVDISGTPEEIAESILASPRFTSSTR